MAQQSMRYRHLVHLGDRDWVGVVGDRSIYKDTIAKLKIHTLPRAEKTEPLATKRLLVTP